VRCWGAPQSHMLRGISQQTMTQQLTKYTRTEGPLEVASPLHDHQVLDHSTTDIYKKEKLPAAQG
jgi:hypothetical protein